MAEKTGKTQPTTPETPADSETAPVDPLDLLSKVEGFYNNAFRKLVAVLGVGLLIVGIIIPLVLEFYRHKSFAKEMDILRDELQKTTNTRIESASKELEKKHLKLIRDNLKSQMGMSAPIHGLFGYNYAKAKEWSSAIKMFLSAAFGFLLCDQFENAVVLLKDTKSIIQQQPRWYKDNDNYTEIVNLLINIEQQNAKIEADTGCDKLIQEIKKLVIKPPD
jgi:hypothetical protein